MKAVNLIAPFIVLTGMFSLSGCFVDRWHGHGNRDDRVDTQHDQTRCDPDEEHHCRPIER